MDNSLGNTCVYDAKMNGEEFVGIRIEDDAPRVYFPLGYRQPTSEKEQKRDILNLISVLSSYCPKTESPQTEHDKKSTSFPIHAYIGVFTYYLNHGYFTESNAIYKRGQFGKIDWNQTIKKIQPHVSKKFPVYLDYVVKKNQTNEDNLITQIHKFCVYESYQKLGRLFSSAKPENPSIKLNVPLFSSVLLSKITNTFNEKHLVLFHQMLDIIQSLGKNRKQKKLFYGTTEFEYVWENLIDHVYGVSKKKKLEFYPRTQWSLDNGGDFEVDTEHEKSPLRPDTIMICPKNDKERIFVLDAKYYRFGISANPISLPGSGSINKQFTYAEYVETLEKYKGADIYNAFIMPYKANLPEGKIDLAPKKIGFATGNWKTSGKKYEKIYGILLDVKSIMHQHSRLSTKDMEILAELIENA